MLVCALQSLGSRIGFLQGIREHNEETPFHWLTRGEQPKK